MLNAAFDEVGKVPLTVFGGAVTEMAPSDLPEGASPFNQDCDFLPGSVFSRGGRSSVYVFQGNSVELLAGAGASVPGPFNPNEVVWGSPNNISRNIPGTYAVAVLNQGFVPTGPATTFAFLDSSQTDTSATIGTLTPTAAGQFAVMTSMSGGSGTITPPGSNIIAGAGGQIAWVTVPSSQSFSETFGAGIGLCAVGALFSGTGGVSLKQFTNGGGTGFNGGTSYVTNPFTNPVPSTDAIVFGLAAAGWQGSGPVLAVTDDQNNIYTQVVLKFGTGAQGVNLVCGLWVCANPKGGPTKIRITNNGVNFNASSVNTYAFDFNGIASGISVTQILQATNFGANLNTGVSISGIQVEVSGDQSTQSSDAVLTAQLVTGKGVVGAVKNSGQLPAIDGTIQIGSPTETWGLQLTPALLNDPLFTVNIVGSATGGEGVSFQAFAVKLKIFFAPSPPANFDWVKTYEQQAGGILNLALDANGILWQEDAINNPNVLNSIFTAITPNTFAKSVTYNNVEYIAFSNLLQGTDMPRRWDGTNLRRISQYGPGAPPSVSSTSTGSSVLSITQNSPTLLNVSVHDWLLVSAGPQAQGSFGSPATPGNVMTIQVNANIAMPSYFKVGSNIQISGFPTINGFNVNNDPTGVSNPAYYTITFVGGPYPGGQSYNWITFQVPFTTFFNHQTPGGCNIQATIATMTTAAQVPFLEVGNQFTLTGETPAGWNNTFTVLQTPNASQMQINSTQLINNVAQYSFTLLTGAAPVVGQFVTVTGTLNGNGIFNVVRAVITSVSAGSFSISIVSPNITAQSETNSNAAIYGTIFQFDPVGVVTNPIIGNAGPGGSIATTGVMGIGVRKAVVLFLTDDGTITQPSPYVQFNITGATSAVVCANVATGPPNIVARIIAFTGAGGSNFFYIPVPVTIVSNGQNVTYSATQINDNFTTQVTLSFPDSVLLNATAIDIQGANRFAQIELGSCRGLITYANRLVAWGVQTKITNLLNLSFDGGIGSQNTQQQATTSTVPSFPLAWTVDPVNGAGSQLNASPLFGNSFYIKNTTGNPQALYGMITQPAYVNQLGTPIVQAAVAYSVRVAARCPSGISPGSLVVDLFSATLNQQFGSFSIPFASMTSNFAIFTGALLPVPFAQVPKDLVIRVYAANIQNNGDVELDRIEPFPTLQPTYSTTFFMSYAGDQEAFDLNTGFSGPAQNQQKVNGAAVMFEKLYMLKETSTFSTFDNGQTEPNQWKWKEDSPKIGTIGIHSYDFGDNWLVTACRAGGFFYEGGEFIKITQEIDTLWELINWQFGHTIWVRNHPDKKFVEFGVPIATPNKYMPEFPVNANPTSPNVILHVSYKELNTGMQFATTGPIRSTFSGRLMSPEPARKWSFWNISAPYADLIDRGNNTKTMFYCSGYTNTKIYQLLASRLDDDGAAINSFYVTHGMPKPEIAEARGIDVLRSQFDMLTLLVTGTGTLNTSVYLEDPLNQPSVALDIIPLDATTQGDCELGVWLKQNRAYLRVGTNAIGSSWSLSKVIAIMSPDPWAPIRGTFHGALT